MYSRIPVPHVWLEEKDMKYTFGFFPLVGVVIGALFSGWLIFARKFCIGTITSMCVSGVFLLLITGGIHIDGYMDTMDAVHSYGDREKKLEMDRRLINSRVAQLNRELKEVQRHREVNRQQRKRSGIPVVAVVGYTNAGKSTLLNHLTNAEVLEEDKLFATLDPTTRILELTNHQKVLMTDTVGFIRKLPHHLIDAFRSTLEEAKYADIILHVVDASNPQMDKQMYIVYDTLRNLEVEGKKIITAFNKTDRIGQPEPLHDFRAERTVHISAKYGDGLEDLKNILEEILREEKDFLECTIPYRDAGVIQKIREKGELLSEEYREDGIFVRAWVPKEFHYM